MSSIIKFFIERSFVVNLIAGFVIVVGFLAITSMKRDLSPPFEFNQVRVSVSLYGASPLEIEKHITYPIEESLKGLPGLDYMTSK